MKDRLSNVRYTHSSMNSLLSLIPDHIDHEQIEGILHHDNIRIERILSQGQTSPDNGWYDQDENEWVLVIQGAGEITFEDGDIVKMHPGDHINIPAHHRHKVSWTDPDHVTVWLAIFYK